MKIKQNYLKRLAPIALLALSLTACSHDLGEHDVGFNEHSRVEFDDGLNHCEHYLIYTFAHEHTANIAYNTLDYHYTYCANHDSNEYCLFTPIYEKHDPTENTKVSHRIQLLYNGRKYVEIPQICSKCKQTTRPKYVLLEEVDK